jgi:hypothetical protein
MADACLASLSAVSEEEEHVFISHMIGPTDLLHPSQAQLKSFNFYDRIKLG